MFMNLSPGAIGIRANLSDGIEIAKRAGFGGVDVPIGEAAKIADEKGVDFVKAMFDDAGIKPGGWGLPINWRGEMKEIEEGLDQLARFAKVGTALGATRVPTWVLSFSDDKPFDVNFKWHVERFRPIAEVLKEHGCSLGLEFLGPKTIRNGHKYEFVHTAEGMLELCEAIGTGNVGLLLDAWHWYTSHGTLDDLLKLKPENVVYVHINDAPKGIPRDEQIDNIRCLPGETGVIDLVGFLKALKEIGYDGPVTPEPFSDKVRGLAPDEAAGLTARYLSKVWQAAEV